ncbi:hypothetical protein AAC387_Pa02g0868 [Persea americana]
MHIPPEPPAVIDDKRPPPSWPPEGRIDLHDLKLRKSQCPFVPLTYQWKVSRYSRKRTIDTIHNIPNLLDSTVSDGGENWRAGKRQLFCLGCVLLKRNRILVLDEATASIDSATDAVLQRVIRQEFASCTLITVAHGVPTVTDSDMVMVLSYGNLIEYNRPSKLMETNSSFSKLVAEYWSNCKRTPM